MSVDNWKAHKRKSQTHSNLHTQQAVYGLSSEKVRADQNQLEKVCYDFAAIRDETRLFHRELESLRQRLQTKNMASIMSVDNWKAHRRKGQTHSYFKTLTT